MFNSKREFLFKKRTSDSKKPNAFLEAGKKETAKTFSDNGSLKYSETDDPFITEFTQMGVFLGRRSFTDIAKSMSTLWALKPVLSVMFILYMRTITRVTTLFDGLKTSTPQKGAGLRHETILRMMWLHIFYPDTFWKNIKLFIAVGCWKDIFIMLSYDIQHNEWDDTLLDWHKLGDLILAGLENPNTCNLVKKYLPQLRANSKCHTLEAQAKNVIAKYLCHRLYPNFGKAISYKAYRNMKTSGQAHQWQQLISRGKMLNINFDTVHGKALSQMVSSKFLANNGLEKKYEAWISSKPVAKYTGFVHELFLKVDSINKKYQIDTLNKQFMGVVETAKKDIKTNTSMIVVRDTSGSMRSKAYNTQMESDQIAKALALFFSYMIPDGPFSDSYIEFATRAAIRNWNGSTPYEKFNNDHSAAYGNTNFQGVFDLFVEIRKSGVSEAVFPSGIVCISDFEFDPAELSGTNVGVALAKLSYAGFSKKFVDNFKIVLWNIPNTFGGQPDVKFETFETTVDNVFYFSGYDPSVLAFLTGTKGQITAPKTAKELFDAAMDQEVLNMVEI